MLQAKQVGTGFGVSALGLGFRVWVQDLGVFMFIWRAGGRGGGIGSSRRGRASLN